MPFAQACFPYCVLNIGPDISQSTRRPEIGHETFIRVCVSSISSPLRGFHVEHPLPVAELSNAEKKAKKKAKKAEKKVQEEAKKGEFIRLSLLFTLGFDSLHPSFIQRTRTQQMRTRDLMSAHPRMRIQMGRSFCKPQICLSAQRNSSNHWLLWRRTMSMCGSQSTTLRSGEVRFLSRRCFLS